MRKFRENSEKFGEKNFCSQIFNVSQKNFSCLLFIANREKG